VATWRVYTLEIFKREVYLVLIHAYYYKITEKLLVPHDLKLNVHAEQIDIHFCSSGVISKKVARLIPTLLNQIPKSTIRLMYLIRNRRAAYLHLPVDSEAVF
jgi:hypothetical protein